MSFAIYLLGYLMLTGGLVYGAIQLRVPAGWIAAGAIVVMGIGVVSAVKATRQRDSS